MKRGFHRRFLLSFSLLSKFLHALPSLFYDFFFLGPTESTAEQKEIKAPLQKPYSMDPITELPRTSLEPSRPPSRYEIGHEDTDTAPIDVSTSCPSRTLY
ncbi:gamma-tubulin complex component 2 [Iris pallida]|uniref:Gamma-tubulin complex component 2 n=1 Tax=Iris pallida TaxID=29817 RepID=A0AAX6HR70_IRIPA|nr:gamma-tubulin complex component 2 [Iris pallida]